MIGQFFSQGFPTPFTLSENICGDTSPWISSSSRLPFLSMKADMGFLFPYFHEARFLLGREDIQSSDYNHVIGPAQNLIHSEMRTSTGTGFRFKKSNVPGPVSDHRYASLVIVVKPTRLFHHRGASRRIRVNISRE